MSEDRCQELQFQLKISILRAAIKMLLKYGDAPKHVKDKARKALEDTDD